MSPTFRALWSQILELLPHQSIYFNKKDVNAGVRTLEQIAKFLHYLIICHHLSSMFWPGVNNLLGFRVRIAP